MKVSRVKIHDFLGVTMDYIQVGKVKLSMNKFVDELIDEFPDTRKLSKTNSPESYVLLQIITDTEALYNDQEKIYHTYVAKILYLSKRVRPDIATC